MRDPTAYQKKVKDYVGRYAKPEDVAALEDAEKHGGGDGGGDMSEGGSGGWPGCWCSQGHKLVVDAVCCSW
jgi:hypothetical protein